MNTITDDQIAEIEALANDAAPFDWGPDVGMTHAETVYACSVGPDSILALLTRLREVERWKADASQVLNPLLDYAHSLGLAKLGHSVTEALIEDHKRLREAERDAARYRWLRSRLVGASFDWDDEGITVLAFEMPPNISIGADCDRNIDAAMQEPQQ